MNKSHPPPDSTCRPYQKACREAVLLRRLLILPLKPLLFQLPEGRCSCRFPAGQRGVSLLADIRLSLIGHRISCLISDARCPSIGTGSNRSRRSNSRRWLGSRHRSSRGCRCRRCRCIAADTNYLPDAKLAAQIRTVTLGPPSGFVYVTAI